MFTVNIPTPFPAMQQQEELFDTHLYYSGAT
jgi:hypothetical protein